MKTDQHIEIVKIRGFLEHSRREKGQAKPQRKEHQSLHGRELVVSAVRTAAESRSNSAYSGVALSSVLPISPGHPIELNMPIHKAEDCHTKSYDLPSGFGSDEQLE